MAVPSYTTDLLTIDLAEAATAWAEPTAVGWTAGAAPGQDDDNPFQGSYAVSKAYNATGVGGMLANYGSGITIPTDGAFLGWFYWAAPGSLDTDANGGIRFMCGSSLLDFKSWDVGGKTSYVYGGWINYAVNTTVTEDDLVGSPTGVQQYFGAAVNNLNSIFKGNPFLCDAYRYGRCEARISGGETANYATFAGFAAENDLAANRWGLIQAITGGYMMKGLMILGYGSAADFRDANKSVVIQNTNKVTANFNTIEIRQATSRVDMTCINITALGTTSRGRWVTTDNADINLDTCVFTDMGTFSFLSQSTVLDCTFRRCGQITTGGGAFDGCLIDESTASTAMLAASPATAALITNTTLISDGTGHGIEIGGTAANMTLTGVIFSGYAASNGNTGNEAIYVNIVSGSMDITIGGGGTTPSIRTAGCIVTVVSNAVNVTVTVKDTATPPANIENARVILRATAGGPFPVDASVTISNSGTTATVTHTAHGLATNDKIMINGASLWQNNGVFQITWVNVDTYTYTLPEAPGSSPTGTITATFIILEGLTSASGQITMSRVFPSNQPMAGWARKASAAPYYKTGNIIGTVNSGSGYSTTLQLLSDQ